MIHQHRDDFLASILVLVHEDERIPGCCDYQSLDFLFRPIFYSCSMWQQVGADGRPASSRWSSRFMALGRHWGG
jgi:hypothetical protein